MNKYRFHIDPGHGWLEVPMEELRDLGIADKISHYSYRDGDTAYLEEDCDTAVFVLAWAEKRPPHDDSWEEFYPLVDHRYYDGWGAPECFIRRLDSYWYNAALAA
jgi:hypothetical protein